MDRYALTVSIRLIGANPGLTLFTADDRTAFASVWRVDWSERGPGHALVLWFAHQLRVVAPVPVLGEWLATDFVRHFPEVEGLDWGTPVTTVAPVRWQLDLATGFRAEADDIVVEIDGPMDRRMLTVDEFDLGGESHQLSTVYMPCRAGRITVAGIPLPGRPQVTETPRASSTAFLADAEVWSKA